MAFTRLDELRIDDPIIRSYLRREIIKKASEFADDEVFSREIYLDEEYRADLLAFRAYGTESLRWVPVLMCKGGGESDPLPVGDIIRMPSSAWISERIRHYTDDAEIESSPEITRRG